MLLLGVLQAQAAGAGPVVATDYDLLETQVLDATTAEVTFSSLSTYAADYQHLQIRYAARSTRGTFATDSFFLKINATGFTYWHNLYGDGTSVTSQSGNDPNVPVIGSISASGSPTDAFGVGVIDLLDAFETTKNKTARNLSGQADPAAGGFTGSRVWLHSGFLNDTAAISSLSLRAGNGNMVTGSRFSLYGIKAA